MNQAAPLVAEADAVLLQDLSGLAAAAVIAVEGVLMDVRRTFAAKVVVDGRPNAKLIEQHQFGAHALSWVATYVEALREMKGWADRLTADGKFGEMEALILQIAFGEYLAQLSGGIPMSQGEIARLSDLGVSRKGLDVVAVDALIAGGNSDAARKRLVELMIERKSVATFGHCGLDDEYEMIRDQFRRFADDKVVPFAHEWHLKDDLIPME
ncbi:MAG: (2S)-methylsuccinyl-CoA dehydrogenase, partial [Paracoccaceae bacterium]